MLRRFWKKGLVALILVIALVFMLVSMACGGGSGKTVLSPFQVLNNTVQSVKTIANKATSDLITANTGITQLRADLDAVVAGLPDVVDYQGNITSLQIQVNSLKATDNATQMAIDTVAGKVATMKVNLATMQLYVDAINDNFDTLSLRLDTIETALNLSP